MIVVDSVFFAQGTPHPDRLAVRPGAGPGLFTRPLPPVSRAQRLTGQPPSPGYRLPGFQVLASRGRAPEGRAGLSVVGELPVAGRWPRSQRRSSPAVGPPPRSIRCPDGWPARERCREECTCTRSGSSVAGRVGFASTPHLPHRCGTTDRRGIVYQGSTGQETVALLHFADTTGASGPQVVARPLTAGLLCTCKYVASSAPPDPDDRFSGWVSSGSRGLRRAVVAGGERLRWWPSLRRGRGGRVSSTRDPACARVPLQPWDRRSWPWFPGHVEADTSSSCRANAHSVSSGARQYSMRRVAAMPSAPSSSTAHEHASRPAISFLVAQIR